MIAERQHEDKRYAGWYNVGPDECDCVTTGELTDLFCRVWGANARWENHFVGGPHEANFLKLDCSKIKQTFGWKPRWHIDEAIQKTVEWTHVWCEDGNIPAEMSREIGEYKQS